MIKKLLFLLLLSSLCYGYFPTGLPDVGYDPVLNRNRDYNAGNAKTLGDNTSSYYAIKYDVGQDTASIVTNLLKSTNTWTGTNTFIQYISADSFISTSTGTVSYNLDGTIDRVNKSKTYTTFTWDSSQVKTASTYNLSDVLISSKTFTYNADGSIDNWR